MYLDSLWVWQLIEEVTDLPGLFFFMYFGKQREAGRFYVDGCHDMSYFHLEEAVTSLVWIK